MVRHSETLQALVLYRPLYGEGALWVRPFEMFTGTIDIEGAARPRFEWVEPPADQAAGSSFTV